MSKSLILCNIILFIISGYAFSSNPRDIHRAFLDGLKPDDIGNEYCGTSLSEADLRYLDERWKNEEEIKDSPQPHTIQPLLSSFPHAQDQSNCSNTD